MTRAVWTLYVAACCLAFMVLSLGCRKGETAYGHDLQAAHPTANEAARLGRGENLFDKGQTKYFPVRFMPEDLVTIHDKWQRPADGGDDTDNGAETSGDLAYYIGEDRFDNVVKLISHLDQLDDEALQDGLVLIQDGADSRPDWTDDINQLCIFAEFENINFWFRVPTEYSHDPEIEHAYWLVRQTTPPQSSPSADTSTGD